MHINIFENQILNNLNASFQMTGRMVTKRRYIFLLCGLLTGMAQVLGQVANNSETPLLTGSPRIIHYTRKEFKGDPQFWTMGQDSTGILYFGNNDGALIFDGEQWQKVSLPNNSSIRCLKRTQTGEIYAGGFNEIGRVTRDDYGSYHYTSLMSLLRQEDRNLENVWQVHDVQGYVIYRTPKALIAISNNKAINLPTSGTYSYSAVVNQHLYVQDGSEVKELDVNSLEFETLFTVDKINHEELVSMLPGFDKQSILVFTKRGSCYIYDTQTKVLRFWKAIIPPNSKNLLTCALRSSDHTYYIGTLSTKILSFSQSAPNIVQLHYNLQDNTVLNLFETREGNIWALLNNGIDCIDISSPVSSIMENAAIFDVLIQNKSMYVATNQGVFLTTDKDTKPARFEKIEGLEGQAWSLHQFDNKILCSHDRGLFVLNKGQLEKIPGITGVWKVIPIDGKPNQYLACTYSGLYVIISEGGKFTLKNKIEGFAESCRDILQRSEQGVFWVCHGYKGVFKIKINEPYTRVVGLEHFKNQNGLPSPYNINVFRWNKETVFTTNGGVYYYDDAKNVFKQHQKLTALFGTTNVRKILQFGDKTWFSHDDEIGYFVTNDSSPQLNKDLFLQLKGTLNRSFECIVPVSGSEVLIGTNTGLYAFDLKKSVSSTPITSISRVSYVNGDSTLLGNLAPGKSIHLNANTQTIQFYFSCPGFQDKENIQYSYSLEGFDDSWSSWNETPFKEYSHLPSGTYTFHVKARSLLGEKAKQAPYKFEIRPLWYQTTLAYSIYFILSIVCARVVVILVKRKIDKERIKTRTEEKEKRKVLELELQQIKLEREKEEIMKDKDLLEEDVIHKSKELANYTMLLVKKRELLAELHDELKELKDLMKNDTSRQKLRDLLKKININLENEEHLQIFEANFERVHNDFFLQLKTSFPDLTQKELRLCAFVRMNLANKEIASILNISVRGVETARYRLRKRLSLTHDEDMVSFLEKLFGSGEAIPDQEEAM